MEMQAFSPEEIGEVESGVRQIIEKLKSAEDAPSGEYKHTIGLTEIGEGRDVFRFSFTIKKEDGREINGVRYIDPILLRLQQCELPIAAAREVWPIVSEVIEEASDA